MSESPDQTVFGPEQPVHPSEQAMSGTMAEMFGPPLHGDHPEVIGQHLDDDESHCVGSWYRPGEDGICVSPRCSYIPEPAQWQKDHWAVHQGAPGCRTCRWYETWRDTEGAVTAAAVEE